MAAIDVRDNMVGLSVKNDGDGPYLCTSNGEKVTGVRSLVLTQNTLDCDEITIVAFVSKLKAEI